MVSIIIPTLNSKQYISQAIQSILNQSYKDYEIIIVDDGSADNTYEELKKYEDKIKYYYKKNGGVASARNYGMLKANGEYICFLDADDMYKEEKLKEQVEFLENNPEIDVVYNNVDVVDEELNFINILKSEGVYENRKDFLTMLLVRQIIPGPASIMIRRKCVESGIKYNEEYRHAEDYDFTLKLAKKFNVGYIPKSLYIYRRHQSNLTNEHKKQFNNEIEIIKKIGIENIKSVVWESNFTESMKKLIFSKILIKINEWDQAKNVLLDILKNEEIAIAYFYLGNCYYFLERYEEAKDCYEQSIIVDKSLAESFNNLGCVCIKLDKLGEAKINFNNALHMRKNYMDARINLDNINQENYNCKITEKELRKILTVYK
ncbi:glycosyltransferase [Clostridium sp. ZS2-4]|uniref:glycosyltransferase n=1 Tax=Clostridium sp. ZS2-4 TaxID=2987703 RepID=UPI00227C827B|nr:glycosyltransferase [Clostridium sp. ZS2-4]MCY6353988.1 glycosyltransferase [Clostridium sp. ZS2-4]